MTHPVGVGEVSYTPSVLSFSAFATFAHNAAALWEAHGLDWSTFAALIGALSTFAVGCVSVSREVRAWRERADRLRFDAALTRVISTTVVDAAGGGRGSP